MNVGLFRRKGAEDDAAPDTAEVSAEPDGPVDREAGEVAGEDGGAPTRPSGPYDSAQVDPGGRLDLGALLVPGVPGMQLRLELDRRTGRCTGAACAVEGSVLQLQAFAAPRTEGIWGEIREEIRASVVDQGGAADDVPGPFGRELLARLPVAGEDGRSGFRPARFIGVDGPRWFLRGVITGPAAVDQKAAQLLELVYANTVVVRGAEARPPRDVLELTPPQQAQQAAAPEPAAGFDPLQRGPEITEIR